jgi:catechol 2,3-dioxygenase-like lactoylglutathione lyase family enzyme
MDAPPCIVGLDHVQIAIPPGGEPLARAFYGDALGMPERPKPAELAKRGGAWFQCGAQQLHAGVEQAFAAAKKAHPALRLANAGDVRVMAARLEGMGYAVRWAGDAPGVVRFHVDDPFGNRIEVTAPA